MRENLEVIIGKYLSGNTSQEETNKLMEWIEKDPVNKRSFENSKLLWENSLHLKKEKDADVNFAWSQFEALKEKPEARIRTLHFPYLKIAAGLALIISLSIVIKLFISDTTEEMPKVISMQTPVSPSATPLETVSVENVEVPIPAVPATKEKISKKSQKRAIKNVVMITVTTGDSARAFFLPDSSIVYLNDHSTIVYPENFSKNNRKLTLLGEAYFEVVRDTMQFIVACQNTITRGTSASFNVKGYSKDKEVEVIIVSGNAEFSGVGKKQYKKLVLKEGERGTFSKKEVIAKGINNRKDYKWWQKKNLRAKIRRLIEKIKIKFTPN